MRYPQDESSTIEWKKEIPRNDQIIKTIIGFCNQNGGKIVVGVANSGEIVGVSQEIIQKALERYRTRHPRNYDLTIQKILEERKIGIMTVLKWFYLLKNHPELLKKAQKTDIEPDEVFVQSMNSLKQDLIQGGEL